MLSECRYCCETVSIMSYHSYHSSIQPAADQTSRNRQLISMLSKDRDSVEKEKEH